MTRKTAKCCAAPEKEKQVPKMVADVYTYTATLIPSLHSSSDKPPSLKISQFMAYANTKACIQFQEMAGRPDRAFRLKVADWTSVDWGTFPSTPV